MYCYACPIMQGAHQVEVQRKVNKSSSSGHGWTFMNHGIQTKGEELVKEEEEKQVACVELSMVLY